MIPYKIGHGYDVHRLVSGRPLILGGVRIPHHLGLLGHSDADCLLHAVMDAVLGALGEGDIGRHFPDSDPCYFGADSRTLARAVAEKMIARGYRIGNLDATVMAERPKLAPYIEAMRAEVAAAFFCPAEAVNIKATTEEGLGFTGEERGIAAHAVCLLYRAADENEGGGFPPQNA